MKNTYTNTNFEQKSLSNYCLVQFTGPALIGDEFTRNDWPEHVTLAGVFKTHTTHVTDGLASIAELTPSFDSRVIGHDTFGYDEERVRVALLEKCGQLIAFHEGLVTSLRGLGVEFKQPTFLGSDYAPHVSETHRIGLRAIGSAVLFNQLSLVDLAPGGDRSNRLIVWQRPMAKRGRS